MLTIQSASDTKKTESLRVALALAGGGPLGGIYELGALRALDKALEGVNLNQLDIYVGVSSGALLSAALANRLSTEQIRRILIDSQAVGHLFAPEVFLRPAFSEYYRRTKSIPELLVKSALRIIKNPRDLNLMGSLTGISDATPTGVFDNEIINRFLTELFSTHGATNDFRKLGTKLYVIAVRLDTSESVRFGSEGYDHVPISKAVQASAALPGLYPPVEIDGNYYVDGVLRKTLHASAALDEGADLVICINPLVPFDANVVGSDDNFDGENLVEKGLPTLLAQTFRTLIHSRMEVGMSKYSQSYKQADIVLFEPNAGDSQMFFNNVFSYANRSKVYELAYQTTRQDLLASREPLTAVLERHGVSLNIDSLRDQSPDFNADKNANPGSGRSTRQVTDRLSEILDRLESWLN